MARRKKVTLSKVQQIARRLEPEVEPFTATLPMARIIHSLEFFKFHDKEFADEFRNEDHLEWGVFQGWMILKDMK